MVQCLITIFLIAILLSIAVLNVFDYFKRTNGLSCANNLKNIQAAKDSWIREYPETTTIPNTEALVSFLKMPLPTCPQGGSYLHLLDCTQRASCSVNGNPGYEPNDAIPLDENGYHDMAMPK